MKQFTILCMVIFLACPACNNKQGKDFAMASEESDSIVTSYIHIYIDSLWNRKDTTLFKTISSRDFKRTFNGIDVAMSQREMQSHLAVFFKAFPDLKLTLKNAYILDSKGFIQWTAEGTNTGVFGEVPPTGKKVRVNGVSHLYFDQEGRLFREYVYFNELDLMQQMGYKLVPPVME